MDVVVRSETAALYRVWYHQQSIASAIKDGQLRFEGEPAFVRRMPKVLDLIDPNRLGVDASSPRPVWIS